MHLDITGRHVDVTPALREFAESKLRKLEKLIDGPLDVHVVLAIEKHRHMAEIQIKSRTGVFTGNTETSDLYASIGEVVDKLERQALKHKEKLHDHKHYRGPRDPEIAATIAANSSPAVEDAANGTAPLTTRIVRDASYRLKPLSPEEAVMELESSGRDVLVFRDTDKDRVHVVYRQRNGNFGLVEPEF